ncbi:MAG: hypothetical protein WC763_06385 [Candidatus Paceibacterota bacterium]|jgi:hypothetical protein
MASIFGWFGGFTRPGNDVSSAEETRSIEAQKKRLHRYVDAVLAKDSIVCSGEFAVAKDSAIFNSEIFLRGPVYVVHVASPSSETLATIIGQTSDAVIAYSNGTMICFASCDSRGLVSIGSKGKSDVAIDRLLDAFIEDGVNVSDCTAGSDVRPRAGTQFLRDSLVTPAFGVVVCVSPPSPPENTTTRRLDADGVMVSNIRRPDMPVSCLDVMVSNIRRPDMPVSCLDIATVAVCLPGAPSSIGLFKIEAFRLCRIDTDPPEDDTCIVVNVSNE